jgi:acyl carrier protein
LTKTAQDIQKGVSLSWDTTPLSPFQQRIRLQEEAFGAEVSRIGGWILVARPLDLDRFARSRDALLKGQHTFLRSLAGETPAWQRTAEAQIAELVVVEDAADPPEALHEAVSLPLDPLGPLVRDAIVDLGPKGFAYGVIFHHLSIDGWGIALGFQKLAQGYLQEISHSAPIVASAPDWTCGRFAGGNSTPSAETVAFWRSKALAAPALLDSRSAATSNSVRIPVPQGLQDALKQIPEPFAQQWQSVLVTTLAQEVGAVFGRKDLLLGVVHHNRHGRLERQVLEPMMHTLPLILRDVDRGSFLDRVRATTAELRQSVRYGGLPVDQLPFPDVVVNYQRLPLSIADWGGVAQCDLWHAPMHGTMIALSVRDWGGALEFILDTRSDRFDPAQTLQLGTAILNALHHGLANPQSSGTGQSDRTRTLPAPLQTQHKETATCDGNSPWLARVLAVFRAQHGLESMQSDEDFFASGGDSFAMTALIDALETETSVRLTIREFLRDPTPRAVAEVIHGKSAPGANDNRTATAQVPSNIAVPAYIRQDGAHPASLSQAALLLHAKDNGAAAYNVPVHIAIEGRIDADQLARDLSTVVQRHAVLRTRFDADRRGFRQIVDPAGAIALDETRLDDSADLQRHLHALSNKASDLFAAPPAAFHLTHLAEYDVVSLLLHHTVVDGVSLGHIAAELSGPTPPDRLQFSDFARWQSQWLRSPAAKSACESVASQWQGPRAALIPEHPRRHPVSNDGSGALAKRQGIEVPLQVITAVRKTVPGLSDMTLGFGALACELTRRAGTGDISLAVVAANRALGGTAGIVGPMTNLVMVRAKTGALIDSSGSPEGLAGFEALNTSLWNAYAFQHLPFEHATPILGDPSRVGQAPDVVFSPQNHPLQVPPVQGRVCRVIPVRSTRPKYALMLECAPQAGGLRLTAEYDCTRYSDTEITQFLMDLVTQIERFAGLNT